MVYGWNVEFGIYGQQSLVEIYKVISLLLTPGVSSNFIIAGLPL